MNILKNVVFYFMMTLVVMVVLMLVALKMVTNFNIVNGSMRPTIPIGALVIVQPQTEYEVDDIITFNTMGVTTTHRLIGFESDGSMITKGDFNDDRDYLALPLTEEDVAGKVVMIIPYLGSIIQTIDSLKIWLIGIVIVLTATYLSLGGTKKKYPEQVT